MCVCLSPGFLIYKILTEFLFYFPCTSSAVQTPHFGDRRTETAAGLKVKVPCNTTEPFFAASFWAMSHSCYWRGGSPTTPLCE